MSNINSFAQNINLTIKSQANQLALLSAMNKAVTDNNTVINYEYTDTDGNTMKYQLPSYESIINRLQAVEESINSLTTGQGTINLTDGTRRTVQISSVPKTPSLITGLTDPTTFTIDSNWFFESLMFPGAKVSIDLTDLIEDSADRVKVSRIILASNNDASKQIWDSDLSVNTYDYVSLKTILSNNGISYYEDEDIIDLPLVSNTVAGNFQITLDPVSKNGNIWYYLDSITYSTISSNGTDLGQNNILSVGDMLLYDDSIFKITDVNQNDMSVVLSRVSGVQTPGIYSIFTIYTDPFASKVVNVKFGAHEYDILYFKGITEAYNLLGDTWSTPVKFSTDELILEGTSGQQQQSFASYYAQYIMDWGSKMIAETKEHKITAWGGSTPNTPTLNGDDFRVVQINTLINAAIDTTDAKNTASEIESVKSLINSLKSTIAALKTDLQSAVNLYTYNSILQLISTNTTDLNNLQTTYSTLVDSFQTLVKENSAITTEPKYHIRGFFPIPEYKYLDEDNTIAEEIIGFDIAYRYIKEDNTSTQLNTFTYTNSDGTEVTGTFTDWVIERSPMKTKVYDDDSSRYIWKAENVADGTETNINQIDIAISKGEQVEIKVRSISECGYPENPLRSEWSNSVIVSFPSTLATNNEIADLITTVNDDALNISITNMLDSTGVTTHLNDTIPNSNSVNGMYYKHLAENIAYEQTVNSSDGSITINSISLLDKIDLIVSQVSENSTLVTTWRLDIDDVIAAEQENVDNILDISTRIAEKFSDVSTSLTEKANIIDLTNYANIGSTLSTFNAVFLYDNIPVNHIRMFAVLDTDFPNYYSKPESGDETDAVVFCVSDHNTIGEIYLVYDTNRKFMGKFTYKNTPLYILRAFGEANATTQYDGLMSSEDKSKLLDVSNNAIIDLSLNIKHNIDGSLIIAPERRYLDGNKEEGSDYIIPVADSKNDGLMSYSDKIKLDKISNNGQGGISTDSGTFDSIITNTLDVSNYVVTSSDNVFKPTKSNNYVVAAFKDVSVYPTGSGTPITITGLNSSIDSLSSIITDDGIKVKNYIFTDNTSVGITSDINYVKFTSSATTSGLATINVDDVVVSKVEGSKDVAIKDKLNEIIDIINELYKKGTIDTSIAKI